tara:strand:- start:430 stop:1101 length:672 start_codon:yes stop_codon:yes gene_type:complete
MENQIFLAIIYVVQFIVLLTFHEWAHAKSANMLGDRTAEDLGRMSLNPAAHIDILGTIILPLMGALTGFPVIGWAKPVPVDPRNLINPKRDMMLIAGAGPAINIVCAVLIYVCLRLITGDGQLVSQQAMRLISLLNLMAYFSVILAVFNMLPLYPLDGFSVVYGLLPSSAARKFARFQQYGMPILMGLIFIPHLFRLPSPLRLLSLLARGICSLLGLLVGYPA